MLAQRIQQHFFDSADLHYQAAELLGRPAEAAAAALVAGLTAGGRVLVAGVGACAGLAQIAAAGLVGSFERERPGLAALALGGDGVLGSALGQIAGGAADGVLARQVETLGQPGDLLLVLDVDGSHPALLAAVAAAQRQEMTVVAFTGRTGGMLRATLGETDVLVPVPHDRPARVLETHLLLLHCLLDAIDQQLLGEQDPA
jgi:D-sedoheptulose 7-phosphate isomerase